MTTLAHSMLDYALAYARRTFRVLPLHAVVNGQCSCERAGCSSIGKHPRTKNGAHDATNNLEQIRHWWNTWPQANIGIATGKACGLYVIDLDTAKGASFDSLKQYGLEELLCSLISKTGSGGYHIYLSCEIGLPNTSNKLGPFIDTRGEGGYVVAPPSSNKDGVYAWENNYPLVSLPQALLACLREEGTRFEQNSLTWSASAKMSEKQTKTALAPTGKEQSDPPAREAPANEEAQEASVTTEARNMFLIRLAGVLRGRGLSQAELRESLLALNQARYGQGKHPQGPLPLDEMERTILKSVASWESKGGVIKTPQPKICSLETLMSQQLPQQFWVVPGLLSEGLTLLAGKPKLGKSLLALDLALTCAQGTDFGGGMVLGHFRVEPTGVLYLCLEDGPRRVYDRVRRLLSDRPAPPNFHCALSWSSLSRGGSQDLEGYLVENPQTRLVVIDTLASVRMQDLGKNNLYQEEYTLMNELHQLALDHHITLLVLHHTRKSAGGDVFEEISGSTGLTGAADCSLVLTRQRGQHEASLHVTGRDIDEQELALTFNQETLTWQCTGSANERQLSHTRQEILDLLKERGTMTPIEIAEGLGKVRSTIRSVISRMLRDQDVFKDEQGRYRLSSARNV
ncbi:MAG TPA: bifunctional DNA primase/polymerase [Ktedonobacteraceae bacterium]|nr:bifunctional DNA primase/polymerase [Ktedonobacteraceae bacterium]